MDLCAMQSNCNCLRRSCLLSTSIIAWLWAGMLIAPALAQNAAPPPPAQGMVRLNFPQEIELKILVDYVSSRLGINILFDEQLANKKISVKAPGDIPAESLLRILESALRMKGLALVDAEAPGWKRIVATTQLAAIAQAQEAQGAIAKFGPTVAVTQAFPLKHVDAQRVDQVVKTFLSQPGGNSIALREQGILIVTDYAVNVLRIAQLIEWIDKPQQEMIFEFLPVTNIGAAPLAQQASSVWAAKQKATGQPAQPGQAGPTLEIVPDERTNQLILIGPRQHVVEAITMIRALDVPLGLRTEIYPFQNVAAERVDKLVKNLLDPVEAERLYRSTVDREGNLLIVTTTNDIHKRIVDLRAGMDTSAMKPQSRVRFYKLENLTAEEILSTVQELMGNQPGGQPRQGPSIGSPRWNDPPFTGPNIPYGYGPGGQPWPAPPYYREVPPETGAAPATQPVVPGQPAGQPVGPQGAGPVGPTPDRIVQSLLGQAHVVAEPSTNSIIVVADPEVQQQFEELIRRLDRRRPQVMIEAKIVIVDTSDNFALGVEISDGDRLGLMRIFGFSSFGLSQVNPITGALQLIPGTGFNGTLVDPESADVVIRALATHDRARVTSAPRILVNDHSEGTLESVLEQPYTSINASQTVNTTSFAGFVKAGTTIQVKPHISEGDHIQLEFTAILNTFTGAAAGPGIPPPRQSDQISSQVTIPDGYTVIVGGLNRTNKTQHIDAVPYLEHVPLLKYLASRRENRGQCSSLFIFLRPVILREEKFEKLRFYSDRDLHQARLPGQYPQSQPLTIPR